MYINNKPFTETLQMAQRDIYDIDTLLLTPLKKQHKIAKRRKTAWYSLAVVEHAVGITFGVCAIIDAYNQRCLMTGFNTALLTVSAKLGFDACNHAQSYADAAKDLNEKITNIQYSVNTSFPEQLHEIAEIARKTVIQR